MASVREYGSEGQRLLVEGPHSQAEVARLAKCPKQRVSDWARGKCRPSPEERSALETAAGIPARAWDAPPTRREPDTTHSKIEPVEAVPDVEAMDLPALGLAGLERLARRLEEIEPSLPPRERVSALQAQARVLAVHEQLRQKVADARDEYLASPEFLSEVRALLAVVPGDSGTLRRHLGRLGIRLSPPPTSKATIEAPPASSEDVDDLIRELETARELRAKEPGLALAHTLGLNLDLHADAIAALVLDDRARAVRLLSLLEGADETIVRGAIERAMVIRDASKLPKDARRVVVELLGRLGHDDIAATIGAE